MVLVNSPGRISRSSLLGATLLVCVVAISSACWNGGDRGGTQAISTEQTSGVPPHGEACRTGMRALATLTGVLTDSARDTLADDFCSRAAAAGLLGEDDASWSDFAPSLQEHVDDFLGPHCAGWGGQVAFVRDRHAFVEITPTEWGHEFCRAFFDDQYFDQKGGWTQSALNQFNHDHPNLYGPFSSKV